MIGRFGVLASRIRQDLVDIERIVARAERAGYACGWLSAVAWGARMV